MAESFKYVKARLQLLPLPVQAINTARPSCKRRNLNTEEEFAARKRNLCKSGSLLACYVREYAKVTMRRALIWRHLYLADK